MDKLLGFKPVPVFRFEDTDGEPLPEERFNVEIPYELDGITDELGIEIEAVRFDGLMYGSYSPSQSS